MREAAQRPVSGPAATDDLAAGGGLEVPGREPHVVPAAEHPPVPERREPIPGERDADPPSPGGFGGASTHKREPGAIGGQFNGADIPPPRRSDWLDERTAFERAWEGGGKRS
jgi:hypothetical protein